MKDVNWDVEEIDLKDYDHPQLPDSPDCPILKKLFMQVPGLIVIPPNFFERMPMLQVLDLSNTNIVSLPTSISNLTSLREFFLRDCSNLNELPTHIGMLTKLKLFDINGTELMFIPKEIGKLAHLEVLRVSLSQYAKCYISIRNANETVVPRKMISELKQLHELCISVPPEAEWWNEEVKDIQNELCDLENLQTLRWYLPTNEVLQQFLLLERNQVPLFTSLSNLMLTIGQPARLISCLPRGLEMKFDEFKRCLKWIHAEEGMDYVSEILASVEALFLFRHWTLEKLSTFNLLKLKYCLLAECNEMETLVDASGPSEYVETRTRDGEKVGLELLRYLSIHHMNKLQSIWKGAIGKDSLSKLKILALHTCPQLTSIFSPRFAQNLLCLTELIVEDCPKVISLISSESHNVKYGPIFPSLERIFLLDLPELVNIFGGLYVLEELNTLLIYNCLKLRLSIMELPHIKKIEGENEWWNDLDCDKSPWENIFVPLKEGRDLIEQLYEATDSLNHFHNIRFEENDELKSSARMSMEKGKETLYPTEGYDETKSFNLTDIKDQLIKVDTSLEEGKGIISLLEVVHLHMGGRNPMMETLEEENLIAAARLLPRALDSNKKITDKARKVLADVSARLTSVMKIAAPKDEDKDEQEGGEVTDIRERINLILEKIMTWEGGDSMIWDCDPEDGKEYLKTVDEARRLAESLESLNLSKDETELLRNVNDVIHTSMSRIEEKFRRMLVQNMQNFEPERFSFRSNEDDSLDLNSIVSFGDDSIDELVQRDSLSRGGSEVVVMDLVNPQVIPDLITIANLMFDSNYGRECCHAFISARKEALDDCLFVLEIEKLSIEDVLKMEWVSLNSRIRRWTKGMKVFVRVYLASEKFLCEQIFDQIQTDPVSSICFSESSKASMLQLLKFAEAISIGPHQPEKLLKILDIYEVLSDLIPDIDGLYSDENGSCIRTEFQHVLTRVGDCVKTTFIEFENAVGSNTSNSAFPGGGNHHLTRYVMNYIKTLTDYGDSLNACLKDHEQAVDDQDSSSSPDTSPGNDNNDTNNGNWSSSPMALHFRSLMLILEHNLEEKSKLYKDEALRHLFMMNNINYMAEKVKNSELRNILGDNWIKKHNWKFQQHAMSYERATWSSILNLLRQDGLSGSGSSGSSTSRTLLRERLHAFYTAFEDIYKSQTGWSIPNSQLREDVRISMSLKVIQAYRNFVGRHNNNISEKYIKYSADDLENYIMDLFEGAPKSLHSFHRK